MLIGLCGRAMSGKSTVAGLLSENFTARGCKVAISSLAAPAKLLACWMGIDVTEKSGPARGFLADIIRAGIKRYHNGIWVDMALGAGLSDSTDAAYARADDPQSLVIIDDIRRPCEAAHVRKYGGEVWGVARSVDHVFDDESERSPDAIRPDRILVNDSDSVDLRAKVHGFTEDYLDRVRSAAKGLSA